MSHVTSITENLLLNSDGNIFTTTLDGKNKNYLTDDGLGKENTVPSWSSDGSKIVYIRSPEGEDESVTSDEASESFGFYDPGNVWVMDADGSNKRQLTSDPILGALPTFSPDGKSIVFTCLASDTAELWSMNVDGSNLRQLTNTTGSDVSLFGKSLQWSAYGSYSPDGTKIIYGSTQSGRSEIWIMNADGSDQRQLTFADDPSAPDANCPMWSPDGSKIVFWSGSEAVGGNIFTMNADGSDRTQLTSDGFPILPINNDNPTWSPDGKSVIFDSSRSTPADPNGVATWIMNADGTNQQLLSPTAHGGARLPITGGSGTLISETAGTLDDTGGTATGAIENVGDKQAYQITLTAGTRYTFNLDGYDVSSSYSLRDPYLQLLSSSGKVLATSDDISACNWSSKIDYTTIGGGTYYLVAASSPADGTYTTGNYQIRSRVTSAPPKAIAPAADQSNRADTPSYRWRAATGR